MENELRPLNLGEVLDRTFQLYRSHFLLFAGISSLGAAVVLVCKLLQTVALKGIQDHASGSITAAATGASSLISVLVYVVGAALALSAINRAVSAVYLGQPRGIALAYQQIRAHWVRYVWLYCLAFLAAWGPASVVFAVIVAVGILVARGNSSNATVIFAVAGFSFLLIIPYGIWMTLRYSLSNACCVFEDLGIRASLKRSVQLTKDLRGKIFVMFLLAGILISVLSYAMLIPMIFFTIRNHGTVTLLSTIVLVVGNFVVTSLTMPFYGIALTLFYYDSRIRKEGFDVDWMMQRAMLTEDTWPQPQQPTPVPAPASPWTYDVSPESPAPSPSVEPDES